MGASFIVDDDMQRWNWFQSQQTAVGEKGKGRVGCLSLYGGILEYTIFPRLININILCNTYMQPLTMIVIHSIYKFYN